MSLTSRSILIWLVTNFAGTLLLLSPNMLYSDVSDPSATGLFLIFGSLFSLPAIPFTYFNLEYISGMRCSKPMKYLYTIASVLVFIIIASYLITAMFTNELPGDDYLEIFGLIGAHTLMAVVTTLLFS